MHERLSVNTLCFPGHDLDEIASYWRSLGTKRVSVNSSNVQQYGEDAVRAAVASGPWKVETYSYAFQLGPLSPDEADWRSYRETFRQGLAFAESIGAHSMYMVTGGRPRHMRWEDAAEMFSAILRPCLSDIEQSSVKVLIEPAPFVYSPVHLSHSLRDTITLAEMAGIGVCVDMFSSWWEADLRATVQRAAPICHLAQVGDYKCGDNAFPCRAVPGDGDIPIRQMCEWLLGAGYTAGFDFELIGPRIDKEGHFEAVERAGEYMTAVLEDLGA